MPSRETYLEFLFSKLVEEAIESSRRGEIERPLNLRHEYRPDHAEGFYRIELVAGFVPDDILTHPTMEVT